MPPRYIPKAPKRTNPRIENFRILPERLDWAFSASHFLYWRVFSAFEKWSKYPLSSPYSPKDGALIFCIYLLAFIFSLPGYGIVKVLGNLDFFHRHDWVGLVIIIGFNLLLPASIMWLRFGIESKCSRSIKLLANEWRHAKVRIIVAALIIHILAAISLNATMAFGLRYG